MLRFYLYILWLGIPSSPLPISDIANPHKFHTTQYFRAIVSLHVRFYFRTKSQPSVRDIHNDYGKQKHYLDVVKLVMNMISIKNNYFLIKLRFTYHLSDKYYLNVGSVFHLKFE